MNNNKKRNKKFKYNNNNKKNNKMKIITFNNKIYKQIQMVKMIKEKLIKRRKIIIITKFKMINLPIHLFPQHIFGKKFKRKKLI